MVKVQSVAPSWLNVSALLEEVMRLNSSNIWSEVMTHAHASHVHALEERAQLGRRDLAEEISKSNTLLYGLTPILMLPAVFGMNLFWEDMLTPETEEGTWYDALLTASQHFLTSAKTPEELLTRIEELFPADGADTKSFSVYSILQQEGVFDNYGQDLPCPVMQGTKHFFEAYGRMLRDREGYGRQFRQAISPRM